MGKSQFRRKTRSARHNPLSRPSIAVDVGGSSPSATNEALLPVLEKLSAVSAGDRTWACAAVNNLIASDKATRRLLLGKGVVGLLIQRLADTEWETRVEASGALRNLCIDGGYDVRGEMFNKNILAPLFVQMDYISSNMSSSQSPASTCEPKAQGDGTTEKNRKALRKERQAAEAAATGKSGGGVSVDGEAETQRKLMLEFAENVVTILWCLAETSSKIMQGLNARVSELLPFLMGFIQLAASATLDPSSEETQMRQKVKKGTREECVTVDDVGLACAHTLYTLTDENAPLSAALASNEAFLSILSRIVSTASITDPASFPHPSAGALLAVLACGILRNLAGTQLPDSVHVQLDVPGGTTVAFEAFEDRAVIPLLVGLVSRTNLESVATRVESISRRTHEKDVPAEEKEKIRQEARARGEDETSLTAVQLALEILGSICGETGDGDEWEEAENADEEDDPMDALVDDASDADGKEDDMGAEGDGAKGGKATSLSPRLARLFGELGLPERLVSLARPTTASFPSVSGAPTSQQSAGNPFPAANGKTGASPIEDLGGRLRVVHLRALSALSNLVLSISYALPSPSSGPSEAEIASWREYVASVRPIVQGVWDALYGIATSVATIDTVVRHRTAANQQGRGPREEDGESEGHDGREMVESAVAGLWGVTKMTQGDLMLTPQHVPSLVAAYRSAVTDSMRVKCIGVLSCLAQRPNAIEDNRTIGNFLMHVILSLPSHPSIPPNPATPASGFAPFEPRTTPEALVAALNGVFDVYADEEAPYDGPVFRQGGFTAVLEGAQKAVKQMARRIDRRKFPSLRVSADEAIDNLVAFVRYRKQVERG